MAMPSARKERGQAHLPNLELIGVELWSAPAKAFNVKRIAQVKESLGREGGLAPALQLGPSKDNSAHHCAESRNESFHLRSGADSNTHEVWHCGKHAADLYVSFAHGVDDRSYFSPQVNHQKVGV
jgi:hypothetical protein